MAEKVTCDKCGSIYNFRAIKIPVRDKDSIECFVCGNLLRSWNAAKMWTAELQERHENHSPLSE
ncbi:hypothetical protein D3C77_302700 [compost metagenome]